MLDCHVLTFQVLLRFKLNIASLQEKVQVTSSAIAKYEVRFVSKASADQRQGRSGRTGG
jgi:hypothetical protein